MNLPPEVSQILIQLSDGFGECRQSFGEELGCRVLCRWATSRNLLPAVEAQDAALLISGDRIGGHRYRRFRHP